MTHLAKPSISTINNLTWLVGCIWRRSDFEQIFGVSPEAIPYYSVPVFEASVIDSEDVIKYQRPLTINLKLETCLYEGEYVWTLVYHHVPSSIDSNYLPPCWANSKVSLKGVKDSLTRMFEQS